MINSKWKGGRLKRHQWKANQLAYLSFTVNVSSPTCLWMAANHKFVITKVWVFILLLDCVPLGLLCSTKLCTFVEKSSEKLDILSLNVEFHSMMGVWFQNTPVVWTVLRADALPYSNRISPWLTEFGPLPWQAKQTTSALCQLQPAT